MGVVLNTSILLQSEGMYAEGGYEGVDIQSQSESLKIMWIRRLLEDNFHAWKSIPIALFLDLGVIAVFMTILNLPHIRLLRESKPKRTSKCS